MSTQTETEVALARAAAEISAIAERRKHEHQPAPDDESHLYNRTAEFGPLSKSVWKPIVDELTQLDPDTARKLLVIQRALHNKIRNITENFSYDHPTFALYDSDDRTIFALTIKAWEFSMGDTNAGERAIRIFENFEENKRLFDELTRRVHCNVSSLRPKMPSTTEKLCDEFQPVVFTLQMICYLIERYVLYCGMKPIDGDKMTISNSWGLPSDCNGWGCHSGACDYHRFDRDGQWIEQSIKLFFSRKYISYIRNGMMFSDLAEHQDYEVITTTASRLASSTISESVIIAELMERRKRYFELARIKREKIAMFLAQPHDEVAAEGFQCETSAFHRALHELDTGRQFNSRSPNQRY